MRLLYRCFAILGLALFAALPGVDAGVNKVKLDKTKIIKPEKAKYKKAKVKKAHKIQNKRARIDKKKKSKKPKTIELKRVSKTQVIRPSQSAQDTKTIVPESREARTDSIEHSPPERVEGQRSEDSVDRSQDVVHVSEERSEEVVVEQRDEE